MARAKKPVDQWLKEVRYDYKGYMPTDFAIKFINFIKLVNGGEGEENATPPLHYKMLDTFIEDGDSANMLFRGAAKTTVFAEYMILYIATYGEIDNFGKVTFALYVSDSIENGVKSLKDNVQYRWENSEFLQEYVPFAKITDVKMTFKNKDGKVFVVKMYGAKTGVRGAKSKGKRPELAILDDLISDEDARSPTIIESVENTVYKAVDNALHPTKRKVIWNGTPFNQNDPLYKAVGSGAWNVNVFPVCEDFDDNTTPETFKGAWPDRFTYAAVKRAYEKARDAGKISAFYQEMMLQIMSEDQRLIHDDDVVWFERSNVLKNRGRYNFYITTDFSFSEKQSADFSVISVWAYNANGDWMLVDGVAARRTIDKSLDDLFKYVQMYKPMSVGIEISGQQVGLLKWLDEQMVTRNIFFNIAQEKNTGTRGFRPSANKLVRFQSVVPLFKAKKIWLASDMKGSEYMNEFLNEMRNVALEGFKSKHDDIMDTVSQLAMLSPFKPSEAVEYAWTPKDGSGVWAEVDFEEKTINSLIF